MGEWRVTLFEQKINGSSKVIYEFDAWGGMDSHKSGIVIMDSTETFELNSVKKLPFSYFSAMPNRNQIESIDLKKPINNDSITLNIVDSKKIESSGINIKVDTYESYSGYSNATCLLNEYKFETFKETTDSIIFYGLESNFGDNLKGKNEISFQKGNIRLFSNENGELFRVEINELFKDYATKYKYKKGTNELTEEILNSPVICIRTYYLIPKNKLNESTFSNFGIYKRVRKSTLANNVYKT